MKGDKKNKAGPGTHTKGSGGVLNVTWNSVAPAPYVGQAQRLWAGYQSLVSLSYVWRDRGEARGWDWIQTSWRGLASPRERREDVERTPATLSIECRRIMAIIHSTALLNAGQWRMVGVTEERKQWANECKPISHTLNTQSKKLQKFWKRKCMLKNTFVWNFKNILLMDTDLRPMSFYSWLSHEK